MAAESTRTEPDSALVPRSLQDKHVLLKVSLVHLVSHVHIMFVPVMLPFLPGYFGVGFVELGLALAVFNIVSGFAQLVMGLMVDHVGARPILTLGMVVAALAFALLAAVPAEYSWFLAIIVLAGIANGVYHPGDYSLMARGIVHSWIGRAFAVHTFTGFMGNAIGPVFYLSAAAIGGVRGAAMAAVVFTSVGLIVLWLPAKGVPRRAVSSADPSAGTGGRRSSILNLPVLSLTVMFAFLILGTGAIQDFGVSAFITGYSVDLLNANVTLTVFLLLNAFGVLAGGLVADRVGRSGLVAAILLFVSAVLLIWVAVAPFELVIASVIFGIVGVMTGAIMPSRDMMVRRIAAPGTEGRVFGFVATGFNVGGSVAPVIFGSLIGAGLSRWVFVVAVIFFMATALIALVQEVWFTRRAAAVTR